MLRSKLARVAFPLFLAAMIALAVIFGDQVRGWITTLESMDVTRRQSLLAAAAVVALQVVQVVVFVVPGEVVQIASGFLFGVAGGAALSFLGILAGSAFNYWVGRWMGRPFVTAVTSAHTRQRIDGVLDRRGTRIGFFLLFVIPGIPKDVLGYVAGAGGAQFPFGPFLLFSMVGRIPGIVGSAAIGASAASGNVVLSAILFATAVLLLVAGLLNQRRIETWLHAVLRRER
tara:strand:- start:2107 stop:2796 length:690 start_codon:yes stop_codon:yes gene_type:complete